MPNLQMPMLLGTMIFGQWAAMLAPYPYSLYIFYGSEAGMFAEIGFFFIIAPLLARKYLWIWATPTSDETKWHWPGRFQIPTSESPELRSKWIPDGVWIDGTLGFFLTPIVPAFLKQRHPRYNEKAKIRRYWAIHKTPWGSLCPYAKGPVVFWGNTCKEVPSTWAIFDEIMPSAGLGMGLVNHVPFVNSRGESEPVFVVDRAKGSRVLDQKKFEKFSAPVITR